MDILASLLSFLLLYKYFALFAIIYVASVAVPIPTNEMLLAVGAFASQGYFNFWPALATAVIANTLGDLTDYGITRRYGERVTRVLQLHRARFFNQLQEELRTDAAVTVFITRFAGWLSTATNFLAGLVGVPFWTFLWWDIAGNIIEPAAALTIGYAFGDYWNDFSGTFELVGSVVAVSIIIFILVRIHNRIAKKFEE